MRERDQGRHLAAGTVGAGAPSDPDVADVADVPDPEAPDRPDETPMPSEPCDTDEPTATAPATAEPGAPGDVVQAVAEFLDDLIDDPDFAPDPRPPSDN